MVTAHGLAGSIRAAQESETFDLSGQSAGSIEAVMETAFATPLDADNFRDGAPMIRLTFVTGAGKQARQKYDDGAQKAVTTVLQKHGYVEDRGAGCDRASAGTFKIQHDTGKNLKTVVVFPKVVEAAAGDTAGNGKDNNNEAVGSLIPENSPGYKIAACSMNVFPSMIQSNCTSWSQKKECLTCIEGLKEVVQQLDAQLIQGTPLNETEQKFYEAVVVLDDKEALVKQLAHDQVENGSITAREKEELLQHNSERIAALSKEGKSTAKALERRKMLESLQPVPPHKLKHQGKIAKLCKELQPLLQIDTKSGRLLSIKESAAVTRKEEILQEIERLEEASREWFEDEDTFALRVQACRSEFETKAGTKKSGSRQAGSSYATAAGGAATKRGNGSGKAVNKWVTPAAKGKGAGGSGKKKGKLNKNDLFGAMMAESSDEEEEETTSRTPAISASTSKPTTSDETNVASATSTTTAPSTSKKKASKKKKKGKKSGGKADPDADDDDEFLAIAARENEAKVHERNQSEEKDPTALSKLIAFVQAYILPLLVALLGWIIGMLFGRDKKPKRKRG